METPFEKSKRLIAESNKSLESARLILEKSNQLIIDLGIIVVTREAAKQVLENQLLKN